MLRVLTLDDARWVATRGSARQATGAFALTFPAALVGVRRRRRLLFAVVVALSFDDRYAALTRVLWGTVYALVRHARHRGLVLG